VVVVGLPLSLDGSEGAAAQSARAEAEELAAALPGIRVETFDERLTTVTATGQLREAGKRGTAQRRSVDSAAATVLLQAWLGAQ
jgi:putative Holliday junction resolvase